MGRLSFLEMRDRLQKMLGNRAFSSTELGDWIHDGLYELSGATTLAEDECIVTADTVDGQEAYALPSDLMGILAVKLDEERRLLRITPEEYLKKDQTADKGVPELYARDARNIRLYPIPDDVYTMRIFYKEEPAELVADGDRPPYLAQWDKAILLFAAHHAHMDLGENQRANDFLRRAAIYVRSRLQSREIEANAPTERGLNIARDRSDLQGLET